MPDILNVKDFGAIGDGINDDTSPIQSCLDSAFGSPSSPHGVDYFSNKPVYFPSGKYITSSPLNVKGVSSAVIYGAGKHATTISNVSSGSTVFLTDGFAYATIKDLGMKSAGGTSSRCMNWSRITSGVQTPAGLTLMNVSFEGAEVGFIVGNGAFDQGSECQLINCTFYNHSLYGIIGGNGNCLNFAIVGGSAKNCTVRGISGSQMGIGLIRGVRFENNGIDIVQDNGNSITVSGCYSTSSANFFAFAGYTANVVGCYHDGPSSGYFVSASGRVTVDGCRSTNGDLRAFAGGPIDNKIALRNNRFDNAAATSSYSGTFLENI